MFDLFYPSVLLILVLVVIHAWFGKGVLERGIIFTDLAIAQFAALGSSISLGFFEGEYLYLLTLGFALFSAFLISLASRRNLHLEAFIGMLYIFGASGIMMVLANSAEGMEHFKNLLASDLLFTPIEEILVGIGIYLFLALVIWQIYPRTTGFLRELLFFSMLAITVTSSVHLAGVLVVFTLLVAPALIATMQNKLPFMIFAALYGWSFSIVALFVSFQLDLPTGYTIVFLGAILTLVMVLLISKKVEKEE